MTKRHERHQRDDDDVVICRIDGLRVDRHPRCSRCHILVGPGHHETRLINGVCGDCTNRKPNAIIVLILVLVLSR